jgi:hypothetical protein
VESSLVKLPKDVELGELSVRVFWILSRFTAFPWPVLKAQAHRGRVAPEDLSVADLEQILELLVRGVERFTSPEAGAQVRVALEELLGAGR